MENGDWYRKEKTKNVRTMKGMRRSDVWCGPGRRIDPGYKNHTGSTVDSIKKKLEW